MNSPLYGFPKQIDTIVHAVKLLDTQAAISLLRRPSDKRLSGYRLNSWTSPYLAFSAHSVYHYSPGWSPPTCSLYAWYAFQDPFFTRDTPAWSWRLRGTRSIPLRDVFVARHLDVGSATRLASIRDAERHGGERFVFRNTGASTIGLLSHAQAPGDLRPQHWWLDHHAVSLLPLASHFGHSPIFKQPRRQIGQAPLQLKVE